MLGHKSRQLALIHKHNVIIYHGLESGTVEEEPGDIVSFILKKLSCVKITLAVEMAAAMFLLDLMMLLNLTALKPVLVIISSNAVWDTAP